MSNVVTIHGERASPEDTQAEVVAMFEKLAEMARQGDVVSAAVAFVGGDGRIGSLWQARNYLPQTIGSVAVMFTQFSQGGA